MIRISLSEFFQCTCIMALGVFAVLLSLTLVRFETENYQEFASGIQARSYMILPKDRTTLLMLQTGVLEAGPAINRKTMGRQDFKRIEQLISKQATAFVSEPLPVTQNLMNPRNVVVHQVTEGFFKAVPLNIVLGSVPSREGNSLTSSSIVLFEEYSKRIFPTGPIVGKTIDLSFFPAEGVNEVQTRYTVVGVAKNPGCLAEFAPFCQFGTPIIGVVFLRKTGWPVSQIVVTASESYLPGILQLLRGFVSKEPGLAVQSAGELLPWRKALLRNTRILSTVLAALSIFAFCYSLWNTVSAIIENRKQIIAIYLTIGSARSTILNSCFSLMAKLLSTSIPIGVLLGIIAVNKVSQWVQQNIINYTLKAPIEPKILVEDLILAPLFVALLAFFAIIVPALRGSKISLVEVLRDS